MYIMKSREIPLNTNYDIIVAGGGPAGCSAAIAAARKGASVLLIESSASLGGMGTIGLVPAWCPFGDGEKIIYKGIAEEIFTEAKSQMRHVPKDAINWVPIDPERLKVIYEQKVKESGADILFNSTLCSVDCENGTVNTVLVANKNGLSAYKAQIYIDCTGDADLAAWAGAEVMTSGEEYQMATLCFEISNVDVYAYRHGENIHASNPNSPIHKIIASGKYDIPDTHICNNEVYPGVIGFNAGHLFDVDSTDPVSVSEALIKGRKLAHEIHRALVDYSPQAFANSSVSLTAPSLGIRESRIILGDYVLNVDDYLDRRTFDDEICRNSYYLDIHRSPKQKEKLKKEGADKSIVPHRYQKGESHGVPYRCLTPKGLTNVLVAGRSISTDRAVQGSTRVMPVCLCMGEAAGKAAVIALNSTKDVHNIDVALLRTQIIKDGGYIL